MEEIIAHKLRETYSQDQIDAFYTSFAEQHGEYEKTNPVTVNIIFGLIDFAKFKESMLQYKKDSASLINEETANTGTALGSQDESLFWECYQEDPNDPKFGWSKKVQSKPSDEMSFTMH
jgi:hypothetical protein